MDRKFQIIAFITFSLFVVKIAADAFDQFNHHFNKDVCTHSVVAVEEAEDAFVLDYGDWHLVLSVAVSQFHVVNKKGFLWRYIQADKIISIKDLPLYLKDCVFLI